MRVARIAVVGLGYVGLPLAHAFAAQGFDVVGYDTSAPRVEELQAGHDRTNELTVGELAEVRIHFATDPSALAPCDVIILAVPTPVDPHNKPDLSLLEGATRTVGRQLRKGRIVVLESTVHPGVTEEVCGPILERESGLRCGVDFTLGYSPERINPGDKEHSLRRVVKVVAGQDAQTLETLAGLYGSIVEVGVHRAPSIKIAEMAKAIENAQRDLNIAFVNEVALLCNRLGISTKDVLDAATTKWNFLPFQPGLVGGHCIGVDPYYLVEKARQLDWQTQVITAGRALNDSMSLHVAKQVSQALTAPTAQRGAETGSPDTGAGRGRILVLGLTYKENMPDTRNSKSLDVVKHLVEWGHTVEAHDPFVPADRIRSLGMTPGSLEAGPYDGLLLLVPHREYRMLGHKPLIEAVRKHGIVYDLKSILDRTAIERAERRYMAL